MRAERLMFALSKGGPVYGTALHSADPAIVEIAAIAGYDWVSIILEHCPLEVSDVSALQRAADARGITTVVHVADVDDARILPLLNEGVGGVVAPQVTSAAEAAALVRAVRFPPLGSRGAAGAVRSADYGGRPFAEYAADADRSVAVGVIIETGAGVEAAQEILAVPGLTFAYIGLMDLSQSLGSPGDFKRPNVRDAIRHVMEAGREHGVAIGLSEYGYTIKELLELGTRMIITPTSEYTLLLHGFRERLSRAQAAAAGAAPDDAANT